MGVESKTNIKERNYLVYFSTARNIKYRLLINKKSRKIRSVIPSVSTICLFACVRMCDFVYRGSLLQFLKIILCSLQYSVFTRGYF